MTRHKTTGILLAATAAALFSTVNVANAAEQQASDKVKCSGINACKGMSECATAASSCKGNNSCKGSGWMYTSKTDCDTKGGTVVEEAE